MHASALAKDTENKRFLSEQFEKRLTGVLACALAVGAVVYAAANQGRVEEAGFRKLVGELP